MKGGFKYTKTIQEKKYIFGRYVDVGYAININTIKSLSNFMLTFSETGIGRQINNLMWHFLQLWKSTML